MTFLLRGLCFKNKQDFLLDSHMIDLQIAFLEIFSFCLDFVFQITSSGRMLFDVFRYCVELLINNLWDRRFYAV